MKKKSVREFFEEYFEGKDLKKDDYDEILNEIASNLKKYSIHPRTLGKNGLLSIFDFVEKNIGNKDWKEYLRLSIAIVDPDTGAY